MSCFNVDDMREKIEIFIYFNFIGESLGLSGVNEPPNWQSESLVNNFIGSKEGEFFL